MTGWTSPEVVTNAIAAIGGVAAAVTSYLGWRHQRAEADRTPVVSCKLFPLADQPGWHQLHLFVENVSTDRWLVEALHMLSPSDGGLVARAAIEHYDPASGKVVGTYDPGAATSSLELSAELAPAGAVSLARSTRHDLYNQFILLYAPPTRRFRRAKVRLALSSLHAIQRRKFVDIKRRLK
jgi:hypothetical protein